MTYYAIKGTAGGSLAYVVKTQLSSSPGLSPSHHEIYDATLFTHRQDAENALDELPHGDAKKCEIITVEIGPLSSVSSTGM